ncbi:hypothetical protein INT45_004007 [Circinella minor]|uniref:Late embryogenesis abundant protein LEA-2 subgroup domain-containing protein n=1 Tax=Circinella minor TaxID=1195481 RepID=A0A8H7RZV3_9FUNG|nr:hypothetical protein INT45_004007 [Circinella minor]
MYHTTSPNNNNNSTPEYQQGYYEDKRADSPYYQEESDARGSGWPNNNNSNNNEDDADVPFEDAATFKIPTIEMNGVTNDPNGLPRFQRQGNQFNENLAFTVNLGLRFGIYNPNIETLTLASVAATAFYPTAPTLAIADGLIENVYINRFGFTNFTFPIHLHYNNTADPNYVMLQDIHQKCGNGQDLTVNAHINPVVSLIGVHITIPTIQHTVNFACPIPASELPQAVLPF